MFIADFGGKPLAFWIAAYLLIKHSTRTSMKTRTLTKAEIDAEPHLLWNAYVDLLANEDYESLSTEQRKAHLVFWYESEVQNGGHLQYFENHGTKHLAETIVALDSIEAAGQQQILREAGELWLSCERSPIQSAEEYSETALEGEFDDFDSRFHACLPTLEHCLETYLQAHQSLFITVT